METFVSEGVEVKKTGREAVRSLLNNKELKLVEITPVDSTFDWKKWVRPEDLYTVRGTQ